MYSSSSSSTIFDLLSSFLDMNGLSNEQRLVGAWQKQSKYAPPTLLESMNKAASFDAMIAILKDNYVEGTDKYTLIPDAPLPRLTIELARRLGVAFDKLEDHIAHFRRLCKDHKRIICEAAREQHISMCVAELVQTRDFIEGAISGKITGPDATEVLNYLKNPLPYRDLISAAAKDMSQDEIDAVVKSVPGATAYCLGSSSTCENLAHKVAIWELVRPRTARELLLAANWSVAEYDQMCSELGYKISGECFMKTVKKGGATLDDVLKKDGNVVSEMEQYIKDPKPYAKLISSITKKWTLQECMHIMMKVMSKHPGMKIRVECIRGDNKCCTLSHKVAVLEAVKVAAKPQPSQPLDPRVTLVLEVTANWTDAQFDLCAATLGWRDGDAVKQFLQPPVAKSKYLDELVKYVSPKTEAPAAPAPLSEIISILSEKWDTLLVSEKDTLMGLAGCDANSKVSVRSIATFLPDANPERLATFSEVLKKMIQ